MKPKIKITKTRIIVCSVLGVIALVGLVLGIMALKNSLETINIRTYPQNVKSAELIKSDSGMIGYQVTDFDGNASIMSPDQFAQQIYTEHEAQTLGNRLLVKVLNITSTHTVGWVILGLLGQLVFAGRMIVQIIASEKKRQSVVPVAFWWMALTGASMLLLYFMWRKDVVGIIGQSTGWLIYTRNLYFIYLKPKDHELLEDTQEGNFKKEAEPDTE